MEILSYSFCLMETIRQMEILFLCKLLFDGEYQKSDRDFISLL